MTYINNNNHKSTSMQTQPSTKALLLALLVSSSSAFSGIESRSGALRIVSSGEKHKGFTSRAKPSRLGWLQYRSGDEGISQLSFPSAHTSRAREEDTNSVWRKFLFPALASPEFLSNTEEDESSLMAEEYMKFLDKRYSQIHDSDVGQPVKKQKRQTSRLLGWLSKELVSTNLPAMVPKVADDASSVSEMSLVVSPSQNPSFSRLARARSVLLKYQEYQAIKFARFLTAVAKRIPQVPSRLVKAGGGEQTTKLALGLLAVLVFKLVLPACSTVIRES